MKYSGFVKNLAVLMSGTAVAQIINFCFTPLITRLYGPDAYGMMGSFMACVNILIPIASLSYPIAIVLPRRDKTAIYVAFLSMFIGIALASVLLVGLFLLQVLEINFKNYPYWYLFILPLVMVFLPLQQSGQQWLIRKREYKEIAKVSISQAIIQNLLKISGGWLLPGQIMLVSMTAIGIIFQGGQLYFRSLKSGLRIDIKHLSRVRFRWVANRYNDFPLFRTPQVLINALSQSLPIFLLGYFFDAKTVGYYVLAQTFLTAPVTLLSTSISNIFYPTVVDKISKREKLFPLLSRAILSLLLISLLVYSPIIFAGKYFFGLIFGSEWLTTGVFAQWMAIYCILWLCARPAMDTIPPLKLQSYFLYYELTSFILRVCSIAVGYYFFKNAEACVLLFSIVNAVAYATLTLFVMLQAKKNDSKTI